MANKSNKSQKTASKKGQKIVEKMERADEAQSIQAVAAASNPLDKIGAVVEPIMDRKPAAAKGKKADPKPGTIEIISPYIRKDGTTSPAFAVVGDTKPVATLLKSLHGKFNPSLVKGNETVKGWIFSPKYFGEVKQALQLN